MVGDTADGQNVWKRSGMGFECDGLFGYRSSPIPWFSGNDWKGGEDSSICFEESWGGGLAMGVCSVPKGRMLFAMTRSAKVEDGGGRFCREEFYALAPVCGMADVFGDQGDVVVSSDNFPWLARVFSESGGKSGCEMARFTSRMNRAFGMRVSLPAKARGRILNLAMGLAAREEGKSLESLLPAAGNKSDGSGFGNV